MINSIITINGQEYILTPVMRSDSKTPVMPKQAEVKIEVKAEPKKSMSEIQKENQAKYYKEVSKTSLIGLYKSESGTVSYLNDCSAIAKHITKDTYKVDLKGKVKTYTLEHFTGTLNENDKMSFYIKGQKATSESLMKWFNSQGFTEFAKYADSYMWVSANFARLQTVL
jgi:uncharacterized OB-fold protein